ncbi:TetR/AcrR family transcriptional regulator [Actinomyces sp. HMSC065F11]|uniref:TetR/AcrR family transcriptional regulator n=1 Tax=Actinomyces sp. HMSC065F11 TaxID=1739395 RepID=UPI0008A3263D|nr:TetR/AcrR family transcriptional regulator [Actinomyces sp. HMSC065F11]OFR33711.1 hypothetical protein HMPREF2891_00300 [Actinomyces sp. HMSC065F11]
MSSRFETQQRLIDATREIIILEGVEGFTLDNVCRRAGFTRGAFYSNFSTKESLLAALAEDEYADLIERLDMQVEKWRSGDTAKPAQIDSLLFDAMDAIGVNRTLYALHTEMQARSVRDQEWGARLADLNEEFLTALGGVLETILEAARRKPEAPMRVITHAVIGIVLRAAAVDALVESYKEHQSQARSRMVGPASPPRIERTVPQHLPIAQSPAKPIVETIIPLLYAMSKPI